jgi:radical SAM superfamily enzyme YgiQ (UPF0313 family)
MHVVLISTYELGHQPFGLASPVAWLRRAGAEVTAFDVSRQRLDLEACARADLVGFYLPMHTATRLAMPLVAKVRQATPRAPICAFGLYAPLNAALLRASGVQHVLGAEWEADLVALAREGRQGADPPTRLGGTRVPRLEFLVPDRRGLPSPDRYARLNVDGQRVVAGYTEASRGCKHLCRHCPIVPVYGGQFRIVSPDVVMADIAQQVDAGARHVTFGDPDFFNGIGHARAIVADLAGRFPGVTYDVTIKVEHLVRYAADLPRLHDTGCLFVTSAVESIDDEVLARLRKGHTRADAERAVALCRRAGLALVPTFVPFTPWTTRQGYLALLEWIREQDLVEHVAPIQLAIRLLLTAGSPLLDEPSVAAVSEPFDASRLAFPWHHTDEGLDTLQRDLEAMVAGSAGEPRALVFAGVQALAWERLAGERVPPLGVVADSVRRRSEVPWLDEPWYC